MRHLYLAAAGLAALAMSPATAQAQDASWGCQVLLCAASQNPSWHGVSYCVPPMQRLITAMAQPGFSWPICHEAKAGKPGHEPYEECPAGLKPSSGSSLRDGGGDEYNQCSATINRCRNSAEFKKLTGSTATNQRNIITVRTVDVDGDNTCEVRVSMPRPRRADPYYFDIPNDEGVKQRFWFNLND